MALNYFDTNDLVELEGTFNYLAKSGVGFALTPNNEQIFITSREVRNLSLQIGDAVKVYAVDNHASAETQHFPSRWRAVRTEVKARVSQIVRAAPNLSEGAPSLEFIAAMRRRIREFRPWTAEEMARDMVDEDSALARVSDLGAKVYARLQAMHRTGEAACLKIYPGGLNEKAEAVYYANSVEVFVEHLESPLGDEECEDE